MVIEGLLWGLGSLVSEWHFLFPKARTPRTPRFIYATQDSDRRRVSEWAAEHDHMIRELWETLDSNMTMWPKIYVITLTYYTTYHTHTRTAFGSLAEWFKAPDLGSGIFGCVSSNLTALIFLPVHCSVTIRKKQFFAWWSALHVFGQVAGQILFRVHLRCYFQSLIARLSSG